MKTSDNRLFISRRDPKFIAHKQQNRISYRREITSPPKTTDDQSIDVGIPGSNVICNSGRSILARIIWFLALFLCVSLTCIQIGLRIQLFYNEPIGTTVTRYDISEVRLPNITVCPAILTEFMFWYHKELGAGSDLSGFQFIQNTPMATENFWELMHFFSLDTVKFTTSCQKNTLPDLKCKFQYSVERVLTFRGICLKFHFLSPLNYQGLETIISTKIHHMTKHPQEEYQSLVNNLESFNKKWGLTISIDDGDKVTLYSSFYYDTYVMKHTKTMFNIHIKQFIRSNLRSRPCKEETKVKSCLNDCLLNRMTKYMPCRLPFMRSEKTKLKTCKKPDILSALNTFWELFLSRNTLDCNCPLSCTETLYTFNRAAIDYEDTSDSLMDLDSSNVTAVDLNFADLSVEITSEMELYGLSMLITDVGGNLGLFLGLCCLSLLQILDSIASFLNKKMKSCMHY